MFDHIVLRRAESGDVISFGQIAEALLYYQHVHLVVDRDTFRNLIRTIGIQGVLKLLQRPEVSAVYNEELLVAYTETVGGFQMHRCEAITITGHESVGTFKTSRRADPLLGGRFGDREILI